MKISIVIPVYNLENYISATLDSVFAQTYSNIEVIAVDDGSTDETPSILDAYAETEPRLKVIHKQNEGVSKARLTGIKSASGEYIGFVDGDDKIDPDMYERLISNALRYGADISHCGYRRLNPDGTVSYYYNTGDVIAQNNEQGLYDLLEGARIEPSLCNKVFRASLFSSVTDNPEMDFSLKNNEDLLMNYFLFKSSEKSVFEDFCPYQYIVRKNSASKGTVSVNKLSDPVKAAKIIYDNSKNNPILLPVSARLYAIKLISAATYNKTKTPEIISEVKKSQLQLKEFLPEYAKTAGENKSEILKAKFASQMPRLYSIVHKIYLKLR
ncbi:MAG: glycosyltransferase [Clostridia bacterium]|nr:glycosyltransferase [Clostridia bacterium]MBR6005950.1 glycosyltransferase [Clostridia bacterium]